ncbi:MAG: DUF4268 domain-containing protein [Alphaproteobacteria bacterium]|nr:DUF4268 domain-containing protein [Alphaproteobacteria bacterium]
MELGRLKRLSAQQVWENEPQFFTPWLAENLPLLGEALQIGDLELVDTEVSAGEFRLDILAQDETGSPVLIENQFGASDHKHLGQLISYVASQGEEATVVWVSEHIKESHRAAVDWLNSNTTQGFDFFAVEVEALQIDDSNPAPNFRVVAQPNNWTKSIGGVIRDSVDVDSRRSHQLRLAYWASFADYLDKNDSTFRIRRQNHDSWHSFPIGRAGFSINCVIWTRKPTISVEIFINNDPEKVAIRRLKESQMEIEAVFGEPVEWQELSGKRGSRIAIFDTSSDIANTDQYERFHGWMLKRMRLFRQAFSERVKNLELEPIKGLNSERFEE